MSGSAPKAPNPYQVAQQQQQISEQTAENNLRRSMTNNSNPMGSMTYVADPTAPSGYRQETTFSPEMQSLFSQGVDLTKLFEGTAGDQLGRVGTQLATPFNLDAGRGAVLSDIQRKMMDPMWNQRSDALDANMAAQGITQLNPAYANLKRQFEQQREDAYDKMFLDSYTTANNAALQEHELPLQDYARLIGAGSGASIPSLPQFAPTPTAGAQAPDLAGNVYASNKIGADQSNAAMTGLYGLGAAGLGGWARNGFTVPDWAKTAATGVGAAASGIGDALLTGASTILPFMGI